MVYGELGRFPLQPLISQRMLYYWAKMIQSDDHRLNKKLSNNFTLHKQMRLESVWISHMKHRLKWIQHVPVYKAACDTYKADWQDNVYINQKCFNYRMFRRLFFFFESYLVRLPVPSRILCTKFRLSNHHLPVERGRHWNIERCERKCIQCNVLARWWLSLLVHLSAI